MLSQLYNLAFILLLTIYVRNVVLLQTDSTKDGTTVCYGELGCFGKLKGLFNLWPQSPEKINVSYSLYTFKNRYNPNILKYDLKEEDLSATNFDPKKPSKFIIHGFDNTYDEMQWMGSIKDLIFALSGDTYNIFGVDWSQGAQTKIYTQAAVNTRVVGATTAHFISKLVEYQGANVQDIHLIGHSLGAHISGFVGERFTNPKIGRITGLDPAGPHFFEDKPETRLDRTDAVYVDAIHTDYNGSTVRRGLGLLDTVGMDDFYPNGGDQQPGCGVSKGLFNVLNLGFGAGVLETIGCDHWRAWLLFIANSDSRHQHCQYVGYQCESWDQFKAGKCGDCGTEQEKCGVFSVLGADDPNYGSLYLQHMNLMKTSDTKNRRLYFATNEHTPFCMYHYQIVIHIANDMPEEATGLITLDVHGSRRHVQNFKFSETVTNYVTGMMATALGTWTKNLGQIHTVILRWTAALQKSDSRKSFNLHVKTIEVNYLSNFNYEIRKNFSTVLCPQSGPVISSTSTAVFEKCDPQTVEE